MTVERLKLKNYRNIEEITLLPSEGINIIFGENAQGKTNLIEALWLFTGCKSFRTSKDAELVRFGSDYAVCELDFYAFDRNQTAKITIEGNRKAELNGVELGSAAKLIGEFTTVVFSPVHLGLIKDGPAARRRYIDTALCQLKPRYASVLQKYNKVLHQRNYLLKDAVYHSELLDTLDVWDERLCSLACAIIHERLDYIKKLQPIAGDIYSGLSDGKEEMGISYLSEAQYDGKSQQEIYETLTGLVREKRKDDLLSKTTSTGPHRDDIEITVNTLSARSFGSQGQQRSCAIALKLGEAEIVSRFTGEKPVALLDDVMSELDESRQNYILNKLGDWQVFITCCDENQVLRLCEGKTFEIKNGRLV
jgi:DNA replication and repair protein RecF